MRLYLVLCFVALFHLGDSLIWESEDAIGIEADRSRKHKQYDYDIVEGYSEGDFDPDYGLGYGQTLTKNGFCRTRNGNQGVCAPLADCYPVLYTLDNGHDSQRNLTNWPLAEELIRASGPCTNNPTDFRNNIICCSTLMDSQQQYLVRRPPKPSRPGNKPFRVSPTPANCGVAKPRLKVVGEKLPVSQQGLYPWMAAIKIRGRQFCGGSLIDDYHVMTAAHCIQHMDSNDVSQLEIVLGANDLYSAAETNRVVRRAARVVYHKKFTHQTLLWDIAIIRLSRQVRYNSEPLVNVVCLTTGSPRYDVGWPWARLIGWGKLWHQGPQPSVLQMGELQVYPQEECRRRYGRLPRAGYIADHNVCAQGPRGTDACQGDSGGPLMRFFKNSNKWEQIGVVSWGVDCGRYYPGVYTRVDSFLDWLDIQRTG